mgnify:CR=1 FL=1
MKQTLHTSRRAIKLALLCLMAFVTWGGNYCIAQETAYKTLSFPDDDKENNKISAYNKSWTAKIGDFSWEIANFNNNQWGNSWKYIKAGRKDVPSVAKIQNKTPFGKAISKIVVDVDTEVLVKNVKSIYLEVASDAAFTDVVEKVVLPKPSTTNYGKNDFVFVIKNPKANLFYNLVFDLNSDQKAKNKKNGFVQVNKVEYFEDASNKTATSLSFDVPSYTISKDQKYQQLPTLKAGETVIEGKTITWSSDNENVATVDENGTVTGVAAGKANITAKFAGDDTYKTSKASYEIIVKGAPSLSFPQTSYTIEMGDAFSTPKLNGLPEGVTPAYTSSNTEVATVDATTGDVKIVGVGTTTITVASPETGIYEGATTSYELTVKPAVSKVVTIDFSKLPYKSDTSVDELTDWKDEGITMIFNGNGESNSPKWYKSNTTVRLYQHNTFKILSDNRIKKIEFQYGKTPATADNPKYSCGTYDKNEKTLDLSACNTKEVTLTFTSAVHYKKIIVTTDVSVGTITIATPEGFGTYYNSNSYILPEGLTAFGYTKANTDGTLVKTDVFNGGDVVPANAALVVKGNEGKYECYATDQVAMKTLEGNLLKGVTTDTRIEAASGVKRYILTRADDGILAFYRTNTGNINVKANRAYLEVPTAMAVASFSLEGTATGINNVVTTAAKQGIYTISGVRLNATTTKELPAGIYIVDGKKVIVK